jgi:hypothetical protein
VKPSGIPPAENAKKPSSLIYSETKVLNSALPLCLPLRRGHLNRIRRAHQIRPPLTGRKRSGLTGKFVQSDCSRGMFISEAPAASHQQRLSASEAFRTFSRSLHLRYSVEHNLSTAQMHLSITFLRIVKYDNSTYNNLHFVVYFVNFADPNSRNKKLLTKISGWNILKKTYFQMR